jgi:XTP/dITP diphosphohydrolase
MTLVLASQSPLKLRELSELLADLPLVLVPIASALPGPLRPAPEGRTLAEDAANKAAAAKQATMMLTLADASGLEVEALGGRPGPRSARFAHEHATDAENNASLLAALDSSEGAARAARFRCVLCLVDPWAPPGTSPLIAEGACRGDIARQGRGMGGFGYDPLFVVEGFGGRTMAELTDAERAAVSPRAAAIAALRPRLRELLLARLDEVEQVSSVRPSISADLAPR